MKPCHKIGYDTKHAAFRSARRFRGRSIEQMQVYQCGQCARWHLSKSPLKTGDRRR